MGLLPVSDPGVGLPPRGVGVRVDPGLTVVLDCGVGVTVAPPPAVVVVAVAVAVAVPV